jgi:hypothetical protein
MIISTRRPGIPESLGRREISLNVEADQRFKRLIVPSQSVKDASTFNAVHPWWGIFRASEKPVLFPMRPAPPAV